MEHGSHLVDILDTDGKVIGQKKRADIDKKHDIHHAVFTMMVTPRGELVLAGIPARHDLPNLYPQKFGTTVCTIRRHGETAEQAALRSIERELFIDDADVTLLGESMNLYDDGRRCLETGFYMLGDPPETYSTSDIDAMVNMTYKQLLKDSQEHPDHFAPTLLKFWSDYRDRLPV